MRIAFFHNLPAGGAKRVAFEFVQFLTKKHTVDLFTYDNKSEDFNDVSSLVNEIFFINGGGESKVKLFGRLISINRVRVASRKLAELINKGEYDLALVMQCKVINSPFILRYLKIPSLYVCHEPAAKIKEPHYNIRAKRGFMSILKNIILSFIMRMDRVNATNATVISTSSLYSCEDLYRNYGVHPRLNYLGVDANKFHFLELQRENFVLSVGALNAAKGQDFLIRSVATIKNRPPIKFIYNYAYGQKEYQKYLTELADELEVSISFDFMVSDSDLIIAYNKAALTAFPSLLEPLGLVPLESMACGTPVVGVAEAGIRETIIHNKTGLLAERDPGEFGKAIESLLNNNELHTKLGVNGRQHILDNWTWELSFQQLEKNIYRAFELNNQNLIL